MKMKRFDLKGFALTRFETEAQENSEMAYFVLNIPLFTCSVSRTSVTVVSGPLGVGVMFLGLRSRAHSLTVRY